MPLVALVAATACWGSAIVTIKIASRGLGAIGVTLIELTASLLVLGAALLARRKPVPRPTRHLVLAGALQPGLAYLLLNAGISRTSGSHAALLIGTESVFVVLLAAVFLNVRPARRTMAGLLCAVAGAALITDSGSGTATFGGDALVLAGTLAAASYVIVAHRLAARTDPLVLTSYQFLFGWLITVPVAGAAFLADGRDPFRGAEPRYVAAAAVAGVLGSAVAFGLYNWALRQVPATSAGISLTLIPVFGVAFAVLLLGEPVSARTIAAGAAVAAGVALTQQNDGAAPVPQEQELTVSIAADEQPPARE